MTPIDTVKENLFALSAEEMLITEKKLYELSELSELLYLQIKDDLHSDETEALLQRGNAEGFLAEIPNNDACPAEYALFLKDRKRLSFSAEAAALSFFLSERIQADGDVNFLWRDRPTRGARIAYVPAGKAEQAYFALSEIRKEAAVYYAASAADAVAALFAHQADYAMLPFMAASGETLSGTERLWLENDLCLSALITITVGEEKLAYALFSTEISPFAVREKMSLTLTVTADSYAHLGSILTALPLFGYTTTAVSSVGEEYGRVRARITLCDAGDATALWLYLSLYSAGFSLIGRYPTIEI